VLEPIEPVAPRIVTVLRAAAVSGTRATFAKDRAKDRAKGRFCFIDAID
jgi:hypothetical protein